MRRAFSFQRSAISLMVLAALVLPLPAGLTTFSGLWVPDYNPYGGAIAPPAFASFTVDAATEKVHVLFRVAKTGTLNRVRFRLGAVTKDVTTTLRVSFQDTGPTTGEPDGTADQFRIIPNGDIVANSAIQSGILSSDGTDTGVKRAVTRGQSVHCVIEFGTFVALDSVVVQHISNGTRGSMSYYEFVSLFTASWANASSVTPMLSVEYDDSSYDHLLSVFPAVASTDTHTFNSGSPANVMGQKFRFPFPARIGGAWTNLDADGDFELVLYTPTTAVVVATVDKDVRSHSTNQVGFLIFDAEQTLAANTDYVLAVRPTSVTNVSIFSTDHGSAAELDQMSGGSEFHFAQAASPANATNFTATTTRRPMLGLLVTAVDDGAGGGGGGTRSHATVQ